MAATVTIGVLLLVIWAWLTWNPAVAVHAIPAGLLTYLEGVAAVPVFMLICGVAWSCSTLPRQRRVTALAAAMGLIYFVQGGMWMLQTTPRSALGEQIVVDPSGVVYQSTEFSCVPAACATALTQLGVPTTEADMAELTQARPGTGSTLIRAMNGLQQRLADSPIEVHLVEPDYEQLTSLPLPALTPLRMGTTQRHMVVLTHVNEQVVSLIDPQEGRVLYYRDDFEEVFEGQVLVFER